MVALIVLPCAGATDLPEHVVKARFLTEGEKPEPAWAEPLAISSVLRTCPGWPSGYRMAIVGWGGVGWG